MINKYRITVTSDLIIEAPDWVLITISTDFIIIFAPSEHGTIKFPVA